MRFFTVVASDAVLKVKFPQASYVYVPIFFPAALWTATCPPAGSSQRSSPGTPRPPCSASGTASRWARRSRRTGIQDSICQTPPPRSGSRSAGSGAPDRQSSWRSGSRLHCRQTGSQTARRWPPSTPACVPPTSGCRCRFLFKN